MLRLRAWAVGLAVALFALRLPASADSICLVLDTLPSGPPAFGLAELETACKQFELEVMLQPRPEPETPSVVLGIQGKSTLAQQLAEEAGLEPVTEAEGFLLAAVRPDLTLCLGADAVGLMYGALELVDRLGLEGLAGLQPAEPVRAQPKVKLRGVNEFLTVPRSEGEDWYFLHEDFWTGLLDLMAKSRLNWLDLHGMYDIDTTWFPNIYPYFIKSDTFPDAGLPPSQMALNLAMLKRILELAHNRGIKVGLMSYQTSWDGPFLPKAPYEATEENLALYTKECVRNLLKVLPELDFIGFRIGESGRSEDFFQSSYVPGLDESGLDIPLYTRTWGARKEKILELGKRYPGRFYIEIKYNGEQYGLPYIVSGGRMAGWRDYSYQNYFSWPTDYKVLWQLRYNGTHRLYRWGNLGDTRRTARTIDFCGAEGVCLEPSMAYYPKNDYMHLPGSSHTFGWGWQRDWAWYELWGRFMYDPDTPDEVFLQHFQKRFGLEQGRYALTGLDSASHIIPWIYRYHCLGPDHRSMAPEYEMGGDLAEFAELSPLDTFVMKSPSESALSDLEGTPDARLGADQFATRLLLIASRTEQLAANLDSVKGRNPELDCLSLDFRAQAELARYYAYKKRAAYHFALYLETEDLASAAAARYWLGLSHQAWARMAALNAGHYAPLVDQLRMHTPAFTWQKEGELLAGDSALLDEAVSDFMANLPAAELEPEFRSTTLASALPATLPCSFSLTVGTQGEVSETTLNYQLRPAGEEPVTWGTRRMRPLEEFQNKAFSVDFSMPDLTGELAWYFTCTVAGRQLRYPAEGEFKRPVTQDLTPPVITLDRTSRQSTSEGGKLVRLVVKVDDASKLAEVVLAWKPLPSETTWHYAPLAQRDGAWVGEFPLTSEGAQWALRATDEWGNACMWPDFEKETPYIIEEPWAAPAPSPAAPPIALDRLLLPEARGKLKKVALVGREASSLAQASLEVKKALLARVEAGESLIIFNQNWPEGLAFDWLPGSLGQTDDDFDSATLVGEHPLTTGLTSKLRASKIVNDALIPGEGWTGLSEPCGLAVREWGKGYIISVQFRLEDLQAVASMRRLARNIIGFLHLEPGQDEVLVIDPGNGAACSLFEELGFKLAYLSAL